MAAERCPEAAALRAEAVAVLARLAPDAPLRWARGEGLLVVDLRRDTAASPALADAFAEIGWQTAARGTLLLLTPGPARLGALEAACPAPRTPRARSFVRFRARQMGEADAGIVLTALKCRAVGDSIPAVEKRLRQRAAIALRTGAGGGGLYLAALVLDEDGPER